MGARRKARECALMILYGMDISHQGPDRALGLFFESFGASEPLDPPPPYVDAPSGEDLYAVPEDEDVRRYAELLVRGTASAMEEIDALIQRTSLNWRMDRMALVDRNVLRMGTFELTRLGAEVPRKVVINEAIEVARTFGTMESGAFVNGILDRIGR